MTTATDSYRQEPHFDPYQFYKSYARPVSALTRLDWTDFLDGMHVHTHKQSHDRRLPTPEWALRDDFLREVLVRFLEKRAWCNAAQKGNRSLPLAQRIQNAQKAIAAQREKKTAALKRLCKEYAALLGKNGDGAARRWQLDIQIEALDTFLGTTVRDGGLALTAAVVVLYYRVGFDSVGVGTVLNLKPNHVRQLLYRLNRVAQQL